ncbi:hypothetical protein AB0H49_13220 [Nocardia sp. NPDC050713]|uniref:hypothetical protein n=1 Tax=unclassified Nocardia TaxID=2637762 RepID=UPI0033B9B2AB
MRDALVELREGNTLIGVTEEKMMGAYSTSPLPAADATAETAEPAKQEVSKSPTGAVSTIVARALGWLFFLGGIVGAVLGIAGLHVEITVAGLILACTAGLVLLKIRADGGGRSGAD